MSAGRAFFADEALLPTGWARQVRIEVDQAGFISGVEPQGSGDGAARLHGPLLPGMPNLHSHAFQRAMVGLTQRGGPAHDSFWSWREQMYRFLERLTPDDVEAIAAQLYVEMLEAGYTSVAEFHYLHHDVQGRCYANRAEMAERILEASLTAGIGLTLLPVFYAHAQFGGAPPAPGQRRFVHTLDDFQLLMERLAPSFEQQPLRRLGLAPHSLRAVTPEELKACVTQLQAQDRDAPVHIHAAEQQKEVDDSLAWSGLRPVEWLLQHACPDARWCLIHATHLSEAETAGLAASGAVAGLCPSTEADLGDGFFNAPQYLGAGGRFGIGGDSHAAVDPFFELRLFEYGQRLRAQRRNVLAAEPGASLGSALYCRALAGGAQALNQPVGRIAVGARADLVVLDGNEPALIAHTGESALDAAIFGPARKPVRDVMVGGEWQVREGRHRNAEHVRLAYEVTMRGLLS